MLYKDENIFDICNKVLQNSNLEEIATIEDIVNEKILYLENNLYDKSKEVNLRYKLMLDNKIEELNQIKQMLLKEKLDASYESDLMKFLQDSKTNKSDSFVFIFSGTSRIQKIKRYRSSYLALEFISRNIPVMYSTWNWINHDDLISYIKNDLLFETPIDKTLEYILKIIRYDLNVKNKIFIVSFPYPGITKFIEVLKFYGWTVIYDIMDDWEEFNKVGQAKWYKKNHEIYIVEKSNIVTTVAYPIVEKFKKYSDATINLLPNALDNRLFNIKFENYNYEIKKYKTMNLKNIVSFFRRTTLNNNEIYINKNGEYKNDRNKIGYIGHLTSSWFDWDSLIEVAKRLSDYKFEIIGRGMNYDINKLPSNITYLGAKDIEEVIEIAKDWKVGIVPFKIGNLSNGVDPLKVYEYLAMELNVVSFKMPQIDSYPNVKTVDSIEDFVKAIEVSMSKEFDCEITKDFLKVNTWEYRVDTILKLISGLKKEGEI